MQDARYFGSEDWFSALKEQIFEDMDAGCFWDKALDKDNPEESKRSHIERHIGKTTADLIQRGFADIALNSHASDMFLSSTFTDAETLKVRLEDCLTTMLLCRPDEFCALAEAKPGMRMSLLAAIDPRWNDKFDVMQPCLVMGYDHRLREEKTNVVRIVFRRAPQAPYGFHIVTAFPDSRVDDSRCLAQHKRNPVKCIVKETGRDLTSDLKQTEHYQKSDTVRQAFLCAAADMAMPRCIEKVKYSDGEGQYGPSVAVVFSAQSRSGKCVAYVSERKTTVRIHEPNKAGQKLDLSDFRSWDRIHRINNQAACFIDKVSLIAQKSKNLPCGKKAARTQIRNRTFVNGMNRSKQSKPPR